MYEYYNGFIFRDGNEGISGGLLHLLFVDAGWANVDIIKWQNEKYEIALKNSAWAFTVWYKDELIGMVRVVSDKVMVASVQDLIVKKAYQGKGIGKKLVELCIRKLPHGNWSAQTTPENYKFYKNCGFEMQEKAKNATLVLDGFIKAKIDGHR